MSRKSKQKSWKSKQKNPEIQTKKIIDLIESLDSGFFVWISGF
jgi:hypothetical protein